MSAQFFLIYFQAQVTWTGNFCFSFKMLRSLSSLSDEFFSFFLSIKTKIPRFRYEKIKYDYDWSIEFCLFETNGKNKKVNNNNNDKPMLIAFSYWVFCFNLIHWNESNLLFSFHSGWLKMKESHTHTTTKKGNFQSFWDEKKKVPLGQRKVKPKKKEKIPKFLPF